MDPTHLSPRHGLPNMDGHPLLAQHPKTHYRPWPSQIPATQLTKDNLPPFNVRLSDAQVGHLAHWVSTSRGSLTQRKLGQYWPCDFDGGGKISARRDSWGEGYGGEGRERGKGGLGGGKEVPRWTDPGLPPTYTSSHKIMAGELDAVRAGRALKRQAEEEAGRNVCMPVKKPRVGDVGTELKTMKEGAEKKRRKDKDAGVEQERLAGAKSELRDAVHVVESLMRNAREAEVQNTTLEATLLKNEARYIQDTDDMFDEWLAYNQVKRMQVDRIHEDHAVEINSRDAKIEALETEAKKVSARLDKEKQKVRVRNERLAQAKSRWVQEQELVEKKFREIEEMALDLDELSELNYDTDESEGNTGFEVQPKEAEDEAKDVKEAKEVQEQGPQRPKEQDLKRLTDPGMKGPADKELMRSIEPEKMRSIDPKEVACLDKEDEGENVPMTSQREAKRRRSVRTKPDLSA